MARRTKPSTPRRGPAPAKAPTKARREPGRPGAQAKGARPAPGAPLDTRAEIERLDRLADLLDSRFRIPGLGVRFGLDSLLGLVPGLGDVAGFAPSAYLVWRAHRLGADRRTLGRMARNSGLDFAVGAIPVLGDLFDVGFKANRRNVELLKRHLSEREAGQGAAPARRRR